MLFFVGELKGQILCSIPLQNSAAFSIIIDKYVIS